MQMFLNKKFHSFIFVEIYTQIKSNFGGSNIAQWQRGDRWGYKSTAEDLVGMYEPLGMGMGSEVPPQLRN